MMVIDSQLRLLIGGVTLVAGSAFAQTPNPTPTPSAPLALGSRSDCARRRPGAPTQNLSERLNQSSGVIHPKEVDPAIEKPAPQARDPNVVPPPGSAAPYRRNEHNDIYRERPVRVQATRGNPCATCSFQG